MTLHDICERLNCDYDTLVYSVIELLEITGYAIHTMDIVDEMDRMYEEGE